MSFARVPRRGRLPRARAAAGVLFLAALLGLSGCASTGQFVWYSQLPKSEWGDHQGEYVIGAGDTLNIQVYEQAPLSGTVKIRPDGRIALPLAGEFVVVGKHPAALASEIEARLKQFILTPRATVNVEVAQPITISTLGEIERPGALTLDPPATMIKAIAQSGGLTEYASESHIYLLRQFPRFQRIRFTYDAITRNIDGAATFPLRTGDVIVFE